MKAMALFSSALLIPMLAQWLVLRWTERRLRPLRWVLPAFPAWLWYRGWWRLHAPWEEYPHHEGFAGFLLCMLAVLALAGWGLAWAVYGAWKRRKKP